MRAIGGIIWLAIGFVWTLNIKSYDKSVLTFIVGSVMLPLALLISRIIKTTWTIDRSDRENVFYSFPDEHSSFRTDYFIAF